jgi:hypothetical protein
VGAMCCYCYESLYWVLNAGPVLDLWWDILRS